MYSTECNHSGSHSCARRGVAAPAGSKKYKMLVTPFAVSWSLRTIPSSFSITTRLRRALVACAKPDEVAGIGRGAEVAIIVQNIGHGRPFLVEALPSRVAIVRAAKAGVHLASLDV